MAGKGKSRNIIARNMKKNMASGKNKNKAAAIPYSMKGNAKNNPKRY